MSDADILEALGDEKHEPAIDGCKLCWLLEQMTEPVRNGIREAADGTMGAGRLAQIMTTNGYPIGKSSILRHRKGHTS